MYKYYVTWISNEGKGTNFLNLREELDTMDAIIEATLILENKHPNHQNINLWDWKLLK